MPLCEYVCKKGHKFDKRQHSYDIEKEICPECSRVANRVMSIFNFTFGWTLSEASHEVGGPRDEYVRDV